MGAQPLPSPPAPPVTLVIEEHERRLIDELRAIPPSPLRDRVVYLIHDLLAFAAEPACHQVQADGVPCPTALNSCDTCRRALDVLEAMRDRIHES